MKVRYFMEKWVQTTFSYIIFVTFRSVSGRIIVRSQRSSRIGFRTASIIDCRNLKSQSLQILKSLKFHLTYRFAFDFKIIRYFEWNFFTISSST